MKSPFDQHPRIFVVDDELAIARMLSVMLQMNLFDAVPHTDGQAALDAAQAAPPDYLISDIMMPGMNGIELALAMEQLVPSCKVMLFSGHDDAAGMLEASAVSGHAFTLIQKPIHPIQLVAAIRAL